VNNAWRLPLRLITTVVLIAIGILLIIMPSWLKHGRLPALAAATTFTDSTAVPPGTGPPDSTTVMAALRRVVDPEIGISIVDLGLIGALHIDSSGNVKATVILTTPECPYARQLGAQAVKEVIAVHGVRRVEVRMDPTLPWDPSRLTPEAKERYQRMFRNLAPAIPPSSLLPSSHDTGTGR
jgi:metal-sulfur cluster biosynthetic enzyme